MKKHSLLILALVSTICLSFSPYDNAKKKRKPKPSSTNIISPSRLDIHAESPELNRLTKLLITYDAFFSGEAIKLKRIGKPYDGGYVIPELALQSSEIVMGYGISNDISFEDSASALYNTYSFGFDGTCQPIIPSNPKCTFFPYNIESEEKLNEHKRNNTYPPFPSLSFNEQLELCGAKDRKLFIKMDIEGNEYDSLPDILSHHENITGIVLEIHFCEDSEIPKALALLEKIQENFILVHVHGNNCCKTYFTSENCSGFPTRVLELSYINKNLVDSFTVSLNQNHPTHLDMPNSQFKADVSFLIKNI